MKKVWLYGIIIATACIVASATQAAAKPKWVETFPVLNGDLVTLTLPAGSELIDVELYDDARGIPTRSLGPVTQFKLLPGEGFNFTWKDRQGTVWYQMVTPLTPQAAGLYSKCLAGGKDCKYYRPLPGEVKE